MLCILPLALHILEGPDEYLNIISFPAVTWEHFSPGTGHSWRKRVFGPEWALIGTYLVSCLDPWGAGMGLPIGQMGKQDPLQQACVPLALCLGSVQPQRLTRYVVLACPLAAAGRHPAPRPELPKVRLPAVRARKFLPGAIRGPACCCPTFPGLGTVSPRLPSHGFPETPERLRAPPRLPWRPLVHSFPLPLHLVLSQVRRPDQRPPRREPARAGGLRSMNSKPRGKLAVGRVKFFGRHRGEVRFCRPFPRQTLGFLAFE